MQKETSREELQKRLTYANKKLQRRLEKRYTALQANMTKRPMTYVCEKRPREKNYKRNVCVRTERCRGDLKGDTQRRDLCM